MPNMFSALKRMWEEQSFTRSIVEEFASMLENSAEMLEDVLQVLCDRTGERFVARDIDVRDRRITLTERDIRRRILVHLVTRTEGDIPSSLALLTLTRDADRIGDLVSDLFNLTGMIGDIGTSRALFRRLFAEHGKSVLALLRDLDRAFRSSDDVLAHRTVDAARESIGRCDDIVRDVYASDCSAAQAVVITLGAGCLKQIAMHVANIAGSIYLPLPEMEFIDGEFRLRDDPS